MTNSYYENDYRVSRFIAGGAVILFSCIGLTISYALRNVTTEGSVAGIALSVVFISIVLYVLFRFPRRVVIDSRGVYIENGFFRQNTFWPWEQVQYSGGYESYGERKYAAYTLNIQNIGTGEKFGLAMKSEAELSTLIKKLP